MSVEEFNLRLEEPFAWEEERITGGVGGMSPTEAAAFLRAKQALGG